MQASRKDREAYAERFSLPEPDLLQELRRKTHQKVLRARMLSGHLQGRLLSMLSKLVAPKAILEIGTFTGYSALCLAEGLRQDGILHTIDKNEELVDLQNRYFSRSAHAHQINAHLGNALEIIPTLHLSFDLVFIDADKKNYGNYLDWVVPKMAPGGILIADNVLWYDKVLQPTKKGDRDTAILKDFNRRLRDSEGLENLLLPILDGIAVSRKI